MTREEAISKAQKLLALADAGGTEHEAALALQRAREVMLRYQLSESDIATKGSASDIITRPVRVPFARVPSWVHYLALLIAGQFDCCEGARPGSPYIVFWGFPDDCDIAERAFRFALYWAQAAACAAVARLQLDRSEARSYRLGMVHGIAVALKTFRAESATESECRALILHKSAAVGEFLSKQGTRERKLSARVDGDLFSMGKADGRAIPLHKELA